MKSLSVVESWYNFLGNRISILLWICCNIVKLRANITYPFFDQSNIRSIELPALIIEHNIETDFIGGPEYNI